jgi:hypothetical protein
LHLIWLKKVCLHTGLNFTEGLIQGYVLYPCKD